MDEEKFQKSKEEEEAFIDKITSPLPTSILAYIRGMTGDRQKADSSPESLGLTVRKGNSTDWNAPVGASIYAAIRRLFPSEQKPAHTETIHPRENAQLDESKFFSQLAKHEGFSEKVYKDSEGFDTIGFGHKVKPGEDWSKGITREEAKLLLQRDAAEAIGYARTLPYWEQLNDMQQNVVAEMIFNLGFEGFKKFKKTNRLLEQGKFEEASKEMLKSKWAKQVKGRAITLANQIANYEPVMERKIKQSTPAKAATSASVNADDFYGSGIESFMRERAAALTGIDYKDMPDTHSQFAVKYNNPLGFEDKGKMEKGFAGNKNSILIPKTSADVIYSHAANARKSALASLGFDPRSLVLSVGSYGSSAGVYFPKRDMVQLAVAFFSPTDETLSHEFIHRSIQKLADADEKELEQARKDWESKGFFEKLTSSKPKPKSLLDGVDEERLVRYATMKHLGFPQDRFTPKEFLLDEKEFSQLETVYQKLESKAAKLIASLRPGGPR